MRSASTGTWRVRAYTDPKRPPIGETTFLVEDYVPDRIEFDLDADGQGDAARRAGAIERRRPFPLRRAGLQSRPAGAVTIAAAKERPGFPGYAFGLGRRRGDAGAPGARRPAGDRRAPARRRSRSRSTKCRRPRARSKRTITVSMAESGGRAVERKLTLPVAPDAAMIGVKPAFSGRSLGDGANADFDVVMVAPDGKTLGAKRAAIRAAQGRDQLSVVPAERPVGIRAGQAHRARRRRHASMSTADKPARMSLPVKWGRYRLEVSTAEPNGAVTSLTFDAGFYAESSADTPDLLEVALDKPDYKSGDTMNVAVTARTAGRLTLNVFTDRLVASTSQDVKAGSRARAAHRRQGLGHRRLSRRHLAPSARRAGAAHAGPRHRRAVVLDRPHGAHARARHEAAGDACGRTPRSTCRSSSRALPPARRRASSSPPSTSAFSISPITSRRRRTIIISASAGSPPRSAISTGN